MAEQEQEDIQPEPVRAQRLNARHYQIQEQEWEEQVFAVVRSTPKWVTRPG